MRTLLLIAVAMAPALLLTGCFFPAPGYYGGGAYYGGHGYDRGYGGYDRGYGRY